MGCEQDGCRQHRLGPAPDIAPGCCGGVCCWHPRASQGPRELCRGRRQQGGLRFVGAGMKSDIVPLNKVNFLISP